MVHELLFNLPVVIFPASSHWWNSHKVPSYMLDKSLVLIYPTVASKTISLKLKLVEGSFLIQPQNFTDFYRILQIFYRNQLLYIISRNFLQYK